MTETLTPSQPPHSHRQSGLTSREILDALRKHHGLCRKYYNGAEPWAFVEEFMVATAFQNLSRIDALAVKLGRGTVESDTGRLITNERIAYEIKVSRSDLLRELASPYKRSHAENVCHRWVLATPPGLVRAGELPYGAGLVEIHPRGVKWVEQGIRKDCESPDSFIASLARRATRNEVNGG